MQYLNLNTYNININNLEREMLITATHSSGKGGQNVNKVASKVVLKFNLEKNQKLLMKKPKIL